MPVGVKMHGNGPRIAQDAPVGVGAVFVPLAHARAIREALGAFNAGIRE